MNSALSSKSFCDQLGQVAAITFAFALPISTALTSICMVLMIMAWLGGGRYAIKRDILFYHPLVKWIYPVILVTLIGIFYSIASASARIESLSDNLRLLTIPILIYFFQFKKISVFALWAFILAMILTLLLAALKVYADFPIGLKFSSGAVFKSHIKTSFFMAISAFFLAIQAKQMPAYRFLFITLVGLMIYYLLFINAGRIGYIVLALCLLLLAWHWYNKRGIGLASFLAVALFTIAYLTSSIFSQRINSLRTDLDLYYGGRLEESSLGSRLAFAHSSLWLIKQHPWLGWGTGSFGSAYRQYPKETLFTDNPHNEYLRMTVEWGMLGLIVLLHLFYRQWRLIKMLKPDQQIFYQGVLLTFLVGCLANSWLKDCTEGYFYCLMTAICFASLSCQKIKG